MLNTCLEKQFAMKNQKTEISC